MKTSIILVGNAEEIINHINTTYIEPRNKVYTPEKDGFDIKQQLEEISAKNEDKMGIVNFIALKQKIQKLIDAGDVMYTLLDPPSISMRTTEYDNALQGWDDAKIKP